MIRIAARGIILKCSKIIEGGGKIVIAKAKSNVQDILEVVGLSQLINLYPTTEEAKLALLGS